MRPYLTLHHPKSARRYYDTGLWTNDTFYTLLAERVELAPDQIALMDGSKQLSWLALKARVDAVADDFVSIGLRQGDRVCIWLSNRVEAVIVFLACNREGLACNPSMHKTFTCAEIVSLLNRLEARVLVTEPGWGADRHLVDFSAALKDVPSLKKIYQPGSFPNHILSHDREPVGDPDAVAYLAFTSGTTGEPKCVMHSSNTLLANARDLVRDWAIGSDEVMLTLSPLSHHIAWVAVAQWLLCGCQLVTNDPAPGQRLLDWVLETEATYVMGVPTHAIDLLAEMAARGVDEMGAVHTFYLAGAPIPAAVAEAFAAMDIRPQNVYGMTENSSHQYTHPGDSHETAVNSCGRGGSSYQVQLFSREDGDRTVEAGVVGQIGGRGAALMLGYFDNQAATEQSFNSLGYFLSGDLGTLDAAGNLSVVGRIKDMIIRGGHNIYPAHIEAAAMTHPKVNKAAAFGVADDRLGERVCLAILGDVEGDALLWHMADRGLSQFDMPEWFLQLEEFPLTASGKIIKRELAEQVAQHRLHPREIRFRPSNSGAGLRRMYER